MQLFSNSSNMVSNSRSIIVIRCSKQNHIRFFCRCHNRIQLFITAINFGIADSKCGVNLVPVQRNSFKVGSTAVNSQFLLCSGIHRRSRPAILRCLFRLCFCFLASGQKYGSRHSRRKQQRTLFFIVQFLLFIANLRIFSTILLMATGLSTMNSPRKTPVFPLFLSALELLLLTAKNRADSSSRMLTKLFIW